MHARHSTLEASGLGCSCGRVLPRSRIESELAHLRHTCQQVAAHVRRNWQLVSAEPLVQRPVDQVIELSDSQLLTRVPATNLPRTRYAGRRRVARSARR